MEKKTNHGVIEPFDYNKKSTKDLWYVIVQDLTAPCFKEDLTEEFNLSTRLTATFCTFGFSVNIVTVFKMSVLVHVVLGN